MGSRPGGTSRRIAPRRIVGGAPVVFRIADDRMADRFAMGAQLVGAAASYRAHRQPREARRDLVDDRVEVSECLALGIARAWRRASVRRPPLPCPRVSPMPSPLASNMEMRPCPALARPRPAPSRSSSRGASGRFRRALPPSCADLAINRTPDVSRSSRWTRTGLAPSLSASASSMPSTWRLVPEPPWTAEAEGLIERQNVAILEQGHGAERFDIARIGAFDGRTLRCRDP